MPKKAKTSPALRDDVAWVYERLGGREAMLRWAGENEKEFFKTYFSLAEKVPAESGAAELLKALHELAEADDA